MDQASGLNYRPQRYQEGDDLSVFVEEELEEIAGVMEGLTIVQIKELNVEPSNREDGIIVLADGTNWDPGSGAGYYGYRSGSWRFLEGAGGGGATVGYGELYVSTADGTNQSAPGASPNVGKVDWSVGGSVFAGSSSNTTVSTTNDRITVSVTGVWKITFLATVRFDADQSSDNDLSFAWFLYKNGSLLANSTYASVGTEDADPDDCVVCVQRIASLSANDYIEVYHQSGEPSSQNWDYKLMSGSLVLEYLG